ncbi:hypothetical protein [Flavobacterium sp. W21_SRS_FM6]|uniref:hypothetical protein n=1 Tax=Flavobacterium sp. W21_SRS_FM6 TaxID=3240268 RepID=UPI003F92C515
MSFDEEKKEACAIATKLLSDNSLYLDNVLRLSRLGAKIYGQCWDTEFHVFGVIASDTDHLPLQHVRQQCSEEFLVKADIEITGIIKFYSKDIEASCKKILSKYGNQ